MLIQGETSVGKTSLINWLAKASGNCCVRINNHEHTDIQEYLGCYTSDSNGKLVFKEGMTVQFNTFFGTRGALTNRKFVLKGKCHGTFTNWTNNINHNKASACNYTNGVAVVEYWKGEYSYVAFFKIDLTSLNTNI